MECGMECACNSHGVSRSLSWSVSESVSECLGVSRSLSRSGMECLGVSRSLAWSEWSEERVDVFGMLLVASGCITPELKVRWYNCSNSLSYILSVK